MFRSSNSILISSVAAAVLFAVPLYGMAQDQRPAVRSMFGPRALGAPINPGARTFGGGISTGPGGSFNGLRGPGGAAFNPPMLQPQATGATTGNQARTGVGSQLRVGEAQQNGENGPVTTELGAQPETQEATESAAAVSPPPRIQYDVNNPRSGDLSGASPTRLAHVIEHNPHIKALSPITVLVRNGTTILTGRVATERDKRVAELLARLQPGVGRLQNDLAVESAAPAPYFSVPGR